MLYRDQLCQEQQRNENNEIWFGNLVSEMFSGSSYLSCHLQF